jgi:hypothetical protein
MKHGTLVVCSKCKEFSDSAVFYCTGHHTSGLNQVQPGTLFEGQQQKVTVCAADGPSPSHRRCQVSNHSTHKA